MLLMCFAAVLLLAVLISGLAWPHDLVDRCGVPGRRVHARPGGPNPPAGLWYHRTYPVW
jgi:hypothetical protein